MTIKAQHYYKFRKRLLQLAKNGGFPLAAIFELTYRCNYHCIHCYVTRDKRKKELNTAQVKNILDKLRDVGCFDIVFTGGEPLLRKDIFDILEYAKKSGFRITLYSNGFLINKRVAKKIASLGTSLNRVDISIMGGTRKTFETIVGKKNCFKKTVNAAKLLKKEGVNIEIKITILRQNVNEVLMVKRLADKFGAAFRYSYIITARTNHDLTPLSYRAFPEHCQNIERQISKEEGVVNQDYGWGPKNIGKTRPFICAAGRTSLTISPYGEMNVCPSLPYPQYDLVKKPFNEGWKLLKRFVNRPFTSKTFRCTDCVLARFCSWCPARGWLERKAFVGCSAFDRKIALCRAQHSRFWDKIAPVWEKQRSRFLKEASDN